MEHLAHPGARHLARGTHFAFSTDYSHGEGGQGPRRPYAHALHAVGKRGELLGSLHWAGEAQHRTEQGGGHYPGEITWVGRANGPRPRGTKGLMTDMFHTMHETNAGQSTVPVHSPDRTMEGERWANQTGYQHLVPERYDMEWKPPEGTHPYERHGSPPQFKPPDKNQQHLSGMSRADDIWWDVK